MSLFRSFRTKLQAAFVALALTAIAITGWQASTGAAAALEQAGYDRLTAIREMRVSELERYFESLQSQVLALATDESTLSASEQFQAAWPAIPPGAATDSLRAYYASTDAPQEWFPTDPRTLTLQRLFLAENPHPEGAKDLLLEAPPAGPYSAIHARYHPTFHRYRGAFGFYDLFLIGTDGRILYTVMKESDLGVSLEDPPYRGTPLAAVFRKAAAQTSGGIVMEDYAAYAPSSDAPAAFLATPLFRAGKIAGILAAQVAIDEVNEVMDGGRRWREQGLGETGQSYLVGADNTLRSDMRRGIEDPEGYLRDLASAGIAESTIQSIRRNGTAVLTYPVNLASDTPIHHGARGTELGRSLSGAEVLRAHAPLDVAGLHWTVVAEIANAEALAPVQALRRRILTTGLGVALVFFLAAGWIGASVTGPVLLLASVVRRLGRGERGLRVSLPATDEIGQLATDFNRMSDDLERTTVSRDEYQDLAGRLITAQEDERRRVARELHDDFTQRLAAAAIDAGRWANAPAAPEPVREGLSHLKQQLAEISDEVHTLSRRLHPAMLDDLGLAAALETECRGSFERGGPPTELRVEGSMEDIPRETRLALYRITQEALRNIQRHANATEAAVSLVRTPSAVELQVRDNGEGFDRAASGWVPGLGLASMEERVRLLGGTFHVDSRPGGGTAISITMPLPKEVP